jgi:predicted PurR-regulated permease PerM
MDHMSAGTTEGAAPVGDEDSAIRRFLSDDLLDAVIRIGLVAFLVFACIQISAPFKNLLLWGLVLAVALYPLHRRVAMRVAGREGLAATLIVLSALLLLGLPTIVLSSLFAGQMHAAYQAFTTDSVIIAPPDPSVAAWPLIGERVFAAWSAAATDLHAFLESLQPRLGKIVQSVLSTTAGTMRDVVLFLASLVVAGIMMAYGEPGERAAGRILVRITGHTDGRVQKLITATIRSVAIGVVGVAFVQALLLGVGFALAGIPVPGLLALVAMLLGIAQVPALVVTLPAIVYLWWGGDASVASNIGWSVYLVVAGMSDNALKPLLLGRGVDSPMPIILIGVIGGMISAGMVGLFLGAVLLAVAYQVFMDWVGRDEIERPAEATAESCSTPLDATGQ